MFEWIYSPEAWLALVTLTAPLFTVFHYEISGRDLILIGGGLFLLWKSAQEIWDSLEGPEDEDGHFNVASSYAMVLAQIAVIDIVFSLDSVITAVGMVDHVAIMIAAIVAAVLVMMLFAKAVGDFVGRHPTIRMLALAFLLLIGVMLVVEGTGHHVPKGYIYFAMAFSVIVEALNLAVRGRRAPVALHKKEL